MTKETLPQTHLQLLARMRVAGYGADDLAAVNRAYWLASEVFGAQLRGTGKPFLCHLVGTAAAAALESPPAPVLVAAVCHGILRSGGRTIRDRVLTELGHRTLAQLDDYDAFHRERAERIPRLLGQSGEIAEADRWSALIWAANLVDDETDAAARFRRLRHDHDRRREFARGLCERLDWPTLGGAAEAAFASYEAAEWAEAYGSGLENAFPVAPLSPSPAERLMARLARVFGRRG